MRKIALIGNGYLGQAYEGMFKEAVVYDEPKKLFTKSDDKETAATKSKHMARNWVNESEIGIIAVPTDLKEDGTLDTSIVEEVVEWLETPLILIKSAVMPGTVDRLVKKTGKKIAVSVEFIGMGNYYIDPHDYPDPKDPSKHQMLIIGGELDTATKCAEVLWEKMSPTIRIHLVTALEAEITKLVENAYGALKVTWINCLYNLTQKAGANFIRVQQAWTSDGRVDGMHQRTTSKKRGWASHCWNKDIKAMQTYADSLGATDMAQLFDLVIRLNQEHLGQNEEAKS